VAHRRLTRFVAEVEEASVVIPTYNRSGYLKECLDSVLGQSVSPLEVIVIDDGSDDGTADMVASFGKAVRYFFQANAGKSRAINVAMQHVRGDLLWIFDDDDVALADSIECRLEVLNRRPELGFVLTGHYLGEDGEDGRVRRTREYVVPQIAERDLRIELMKGCFVTMQSMLVRTELIRRAGDFDVALRASEDYDMMLRLSALAPFEILRRPTFVFRQHPGPRGRKEARYSAADRQEIFRKYDGIVGRKLRATSPLVSFVTRPDELEGTEGMLKALLTRMEVMASKGLLDEMFDDLHAALRQTGAAGAQMIARRVSVAVRGGYAYPAIADDPSKFFAGIKGVRRVDGGATVLAGLAAGLATLAKSYPGSIWDRLQKLHLAVRVMYLAMETTR